jgi:regulator of sirC expression with transglutaminase-like and TPR domain
VSELLLAIEPGSISELRDRALLAYHLDDFASALRDLESYLRLIRPNPVRDDNHAANVSDDQQIRVQVRKLHGASLD